ncbi:hypothetical protein [Promicromonospora sp. NPDC050262]|uniref:hypothetical protein n=1 Tax=Promicromonospora sp. NPDC050262 TaxID=3155036 RepID=UPI0033DDD8F8
MGDQSTTWQLRGTGGRFVAAIFCVLLTVGIGIVSSGPASAEIKWDQCAYNKGEFVSSREKIATLQEDGRVCLSPRLNWDNAYFDVMHKSMCGDNFCAIQADEPYYRVWAFGGCAKTHISGFSGGFVGVNHGSLRTELWLYGYNQIFINGGDSRGIPWASAYSVDTCK